MADETSCPRRDDLQQFLLGRLAEADAEPLQQHLKDCPNCLDTLHSLESDDTLIAAMRAQGNAKGRSKDAIVESLIAHLSGLQPLIAASAPETVAGVQASPLSRSADFRFLAPAEGPDELGRLGGYRILKTLGAGGMGIVFEAEDPRLKRRVALKVMRPALAVHEAARVRFQREAEAIAALEHDHIVAIHQVGEDHGLPFLAMPLLKGESLQDRLDREGTLTPTDVLRIGREIATGLAAAHERGLIHRDVKPANVWLEGSAGRVKLLDFGLARPMAEDAHLTQEGVVVGTPHYMAPEQAAGKPVDHRCDLFSVGSVLYHMATGKLPFPGGNVMEVLQALASTQPIPPNQHDSKVPSALNDLILKLLARELGDRPSSAQAVVETIAAIERPPEIAKRKRRPLIAAVIGLLALGLTAATVLGGPAVYRFATNQGQLIVETNDADVEVSVKQNGKLIRIVDAKTGREVSVNLKAGLYQIELTKGKEGLKLSTPEFTLERNGEQIVKVRFEPAAVPVPPTVAPASQPFVIMANGGSAERIFPTLVAAVAAATSGDTIEIRGTGPFVTDPVTIGDKALTLRAGQGFTPVIQLSAAAFRARATLLETSGPLSVEGLEFHRVGTDEPPFEQERRLLVSWRAPLHLAHCRFLVKGRGTNGAVHAFLSPRFDVRSCFFTGDPDTPLSLLHWGRPSGGRMTVENCLSVTKNNGLTVTQHGFDSGEASVRLTHNTFLAGNVIGFNFGESDSVRDTKVPPTPVEASGNLFDVGVIFSFGQVSKARPPLEFMAGQARLRELFMWRDQRNVYRVLGDYLWIHYDPPPRQTVKGVKGLAEWHALWEAKDTGSREGQPRYQSPRLTARDFSRPEELRVEDFRLQPGSPGQGAGEGGRDLGADVDMVGPGKAYEEWKKTPEYESWLAATGQTKPFVVLAADKSERKFSSLAEAVTAAMSGDTVEIRGNGPFVTPKINLFGKKRALILRAGAGFQPVLQDDGQCRERNTYLLCTDGPLVVEGLHFRHVEDPAIKEGIYTLIRSHEAPLSVTHCRFFLKSSRNSAALASDKSPRVQVQHCEFAGTANMAISSHPASFGELEVADCLCWGTKGFVHYNHVLPPEPRDFAVRMYRNTFVASAGSSAVMQQYGQLPEPPANADLRPFRIDAQENVLDSEVVFHLVQNEQGKFKPEVDQPLLARCLTWNESKNLYAGVLLRLQEYKGRLVDSIKTEAEWRGFWGLKDTGSAHGRLRYQGGNVKAAKAATPEKLTAADFRLHKNSDGKGDGENGRDLGADVDKLGPGKAYEDWKKTPAYPKWLAATGQVRDPEPFVVMPADKKRERMYTNLKDAVEDAQAGDVIEIRGDGPFVTEPVNIADKALTLRAGHGFAPVIQLSAAGIKKGAALLVTNAPLTVEGLEFHRVGADELDAALQRCLLLSVRAPLRLAHCQFVLKGNGWNMAVCAVEAPLFEVRNCVLVSAPGSGFHWVRPSGGQMAVENCLIYVRDGGLSVYQVGFDSGKAAIRVARNTILAGTPVGFRWRETDTPRKSAGPPTLVEATDNVLDGHALHFHEDAKERRPLEVKASQDRLRELLAWKDKRNLYRCSDVFLVMQSTPLPPQTAKGPTSLKEWDALWNAKDNQSFEGQPLYQSPRLNSRDLSRPEEVRVEDFRLQPGSSGQGAGEGGRDLGATVELVGPGPAYDYWHRTPAYQEWLKTTAPIK